MHFKYYNYDRIASLLSWFSKSSSVSTSNSTSVSIASSSSSSLSLLMLSMPSSSTKQNFSATLHPDYPSILDAPNQPCSFHFPRHTFGSKNRVKQGFNGSWFDSYTWLHYNLAFCFLC